MRVRRWGRRGRRRWRQWRVPGAHVARAEGERAELELPEEFWHPRPGHRGGVRLQRGARVALVVVDVDEAPGGMCAMQLSDTLGGRKLGARCISMGKLWHVSASWHHQPVLGYPSRNGTTSQY